MNRNVLTIFVLTIAALVVLYLYSFGPLSKMREAKPNPASVAPAGSERISIPRPFPSKEASAVPAQTTAATNEIAFILYHNKDKKENFYTINFPADWQVHAGSKLGGYTLTFNGGSGSVELMDVPDNTTLELYILSREEPRLKKSVSEYRRIGYRKEIVHGREAYELIYTGDSAGKNEIGAIYIAGPDEAIVIKFAAPPGEFDSKHALFDAVVSSFQWQSK